MKITLYGNREIDRQIAMMCLGWTVFYDSAKTSIGSLIGLDSDKNDFVVEGLYEAFGFFETDDNYRDCAQITIDLSKVDLDLRLAIGTDIEFEGRFNRMPFKIANCKKSKEGLRFNYTPKIGYLIDESDMGYLGSELTISTDWLKENGIEVEE